MKTTKFWTILLAGVTLAGMPLAASAQEEGTKAGRELRTAYDKSLQGKTIAVWRGRRPKVTGRGLPTS